MQHLAYAFLIALANNVDNLGARIAYSLQGVRISIPINLWIAVLTLVISTAAALSGTFLAGSLGPKVASMIAMGMLVGLGLWVIWQEYSKHHMRAEHPAGTKPSLWAIYKNPVHADTDLSKHIDFKEATVLGIALSINNIGGGLSAGMVGINPYLVGMLSAMLSFIALWAGNYVAEFFVRRRWDDKAAVVGGILLIAIGIKQGVG